MIERFSERSKIIDRTAEMENKTDPKEKSKLAAKTRVSKNKSVPEDELLDVWKDLLSTQEFEELQKLKNKPQVQSKNITAKEAIDRSLSHFLERNSIAEENRVIGYALQLGYGALLDEDVRAELNGRDNIVKGEKDSVSVITTREMIWAEDRMIELATYGKGKFRPLNPNHKIERHYLNKDQVNAVKEILNSNDQVIAIEGKAGSGKSTMLQELANGLKSVGKSMIPIAPSSQAVEVLRKEGFQESQTIASFLIRPELQLKIRNNVLCVDEASLTGVKTKSRLLEIAKEQNARVLLSGNIRQHSSPGEYGDSLRILQQQAKIKTVHLGQNMRQKPDDYREAVNLISRGENLKGYQILDQKMKAVEEVPEYDLLLDKISDDYVNSVKSGRSALVVSPTNLEGSKITEIIRQKLKKEGKIKQEERVFETLRDLSLTESQKKDLTTYEQGQLIRFVRHQSSKDSKTGFRAGGHYEVLRIKKGDEIKVRDINSNKVLTLPHKEPKYFSVYRRTQTRLSPGDLIRPTVNLKSEENTKINNGTPQVVKSFEGQNIKLANGRTLAKDSFHFKHGYVDTSHSSQGKTAQDVFVSLTDASMGAVNEQAFYVSVSRGRSQIKLYTTDKRELKSAIGRSGERTSARELARRHEHRLLQQKQRNHYQSRLKKKEIYAISRQKQTKTTRDISNRVQSDR